MHVEYHPELLRQFLNGTDDLIHRIVIILNRCFIHASHQILLILKSSHVRILYLSVAGDIVDWNVHHDLIEPGLHRIGILQPADTFKGLNETVMQQVLGLVTRMGVAHADTQHHGSKAVIQHLLRCRQPPLATSHYYFHFGFHSLYRHTNIIFVAKKRKKNQ